MSKDIRIKKGLDLKLKGEAENTLSVVSRSKVYAINPSDFHGITPKMVVKEGAKVKAGEVIFYSKNDESVKFVSPVSGTIQEIIRGEKSRRRLTGEEAFLHYVTYSRLELTKL